MSYKLLTQAIQDTAKKGDLASLGEFVNAEHPADLTQFVGTLDVMDAGTVLDLLPIEKQADCSAVSATASRSSLPIMRRAESWPARSAAVRAGPEIALDKDARAFPLPSSRGPRSGNPGSSAR